MKLQAARSIYRYETVRLFRVIVQSAITPIISTSLYFIVLGQMVGSAMHEMNGVDFMAYIVPGLIVLTVLTESVANASFGIYLPRYTGAIYEILAAPIGALEVVIGHLAAAATKSVLIGLVILVTARFFVPFEIHHPFVAAGILLLGAVSFCAVGFVVGIMANSIEQLQVAPFLVITPLTILGGAFYSINRLSEPWRSLALLNPTAYFVEGLRWSFYGRSDIPISNSMTVCGACLAISLSIIALIFRLQYRLRS